MGFMELHDALSQIADIRLQMARTHTFRGYRSSTTLFSAVLAVATDSASSREATWFSIFAW